MTLNQLKTKANTKLGEFWSALQTKQDAYFAKHGKYFQLLVTASVVDGEDTTFEVRKPNDELHAIDVDFEFNSPVPFQMQVDEMYGRNTHFSATATIELPNGDVYKRTRKSTGEDTNWYKFIDE